jgi:hypothetical protein
MVPSRSLAWVVVVVAALMPRAGAQELDGTWQAETHGWRRLRVSHGAARLEVDWPGRGPVVLVGASQGREAVVYAAEVATPGLAGVVEGREAAPARPPLAVQVRLTRDDADGAQADATWREGEQVVRRERWTRPGPPRLELLAIEPESPWAPKTQGPLRARFRLEGGPVALRLRVVVQPGDLDGRSDESASERRRVEFYQERLSAREDRRPTRVVIFERELGELEPGEHEVEWDGRDGSSDARLALGGGYRVVLLGDGVQAEGRLVVAPPTSEFVGPRWPRSWVRDSTGAEKLDPGRDRRSAHGVASPQLRYLGFEPPPDTLLRAVTPTQTFEALETAAVVTIATHGTPRELALYTDPDDTLMQPEHVASIGVSELGARAEALAQEKPLKDLHAVVLWACLTGSDGARVPRALIARGADVVVCFESIIQATGLDLFVKNAFLKSLELSKETGRPLTIDVAMHEAAAASDRIVWREVSDEDKRVVAEWRASGSRPLKEVLRVELAAGIDPRTEQLAPARWGCSTN